MVPDTKGAGLHYSLTDICNSQFSATLHNPRGATLSVSVCGRVKCGEGAARGCISVPGVQPTITGMISMCTIYAVYITGFEWEL